MTEILVNPLTTTPTQAWNELSKTQRVIKINYRSPQTENSDPKKIRIVCMSDTHSLNHYFKFEIPDGDIFIHAGDFTAGGKLDEVLAFNKWLGNLPHKYKIVIAGNHELYFDPSFRGLLASPNQSGRTKHNSGLINKIPFLGKAGDPESTEAAAKMKEFLTNCIYLEDSGIELYGIKFWGTPWQPENGPWAFGLPRGQELLDKWNLIPEDTDILITHTPPLGFGDKTAQSENSGCAELLTTIQQRVKPKYAIFGHIHESYGVMSDGKTVFINASTCDINYLPNNPPVAFDMEIKAEMKEEEVKEAPSVKTPVDDGQKTWCSIM